MEYKTIPHSVKAITGRTVTGIFAVHGNIDNGGDRSFPGAFAKTIAERGGQIKHLWGHDFYAPPIAKVISLREIGRDELPEGVLAKAPDALGGVEVVREYLKTARGDEVFAGIESGAITEMSYAYDAVKFDFEEINGQRTRNLRECRLFETSDVLWGLNPATQGSKGDAALQSILDSLNGRLALKRGDISARDMEIINAILTSASALASTKQPASGGRAEVFTSLTDLDAKLMDLGIALMQ